MWALPRAAAWEPSPFAGRLPSGGRAARGPEPASGTPQARALPALPDPPGGSGAPVLPKAWGINLKQLIASERSHQRLNKHNLTEGMIIDLVKMRKKGKLN